ncbi:MAG: DegV family protein, partial [Eubacterium sp.]|nr:DegV family protein [Eubacterium sp.]
MGDYVLSCCSTIDLSKEYIEKRDIHMISFHYFLGDKEYVDDLGQTISMQEFYQRMADGEMTRTSQVNVEEYIEYFESFLKEGKDILHLTLSSGISGTINSCRIAKEDLKERYPERKIIVLDSLAASAGYGLLMDKLADLRDQGKSMEEVAEWAEDHKLELNHWFFSGDLTFFIRGGRITPTAGFVGKVLNICPFMNVDLNGKLIVRQKVRTKKKVIQTMANKCLELIKDGKNYSEKIYISNSA